MRNKIFITIKGGIVTDIDVSPDLAKLNVTVVDMDTDGDDSDYTGILPDGDEAVVFEMTPCVIDVENGEDGYWDDIIRLRDNIPRL